MDGPQAALMRGLCAQHSAALSRYTRRLTGQRARAVHVVPETLIRAWQHSELVDHTDRSPRVRLLTVARHMVIDERRAR